MTTSSLPSTGSSILIVDDDPDIGMTLTDLLGGEGHQVEIVCTGGDALERVTSRHFDAVLLDVGLPDIDGLAVLTDILERKPHLPVIILSAYTSLERSVGPLDLYGAYAYVTKPFDRQALKATVRKAISLGTLATQLERFQSTLNQKEIQLHSILESATDGIILADAQGLITGWNRAAGSLFGYLESEVMGKSLTMLMPPSYRDTHQQGLKRLSMTGRSQIVGKTIELEALRKDGSIFPIELSLGTWTREEETFFCGMVRDITIRKDGETRVKHQQDLERLVAIISTHFTNLPPSKIDDAISSALKSLGKLWEVDWCYVLLFSEASHAVAKRYEWRVQNMEPQGQGSSYQPTPWWFEQMTRHDLMAFSKITNLPDDAQAEREAWQRHGIQSQMTVPLVQGKKVIGCLGLQAIRKAKVWDEADPLFLKTVAGIFVNALNNQRAEEALQNNEELLRQVMDNTTAVIYVKWADGRYRLINRQFEKLFNITLKEIQHKTDYDVFPKSIADAFRANDLAVLRTGTVLEVEEQAPHSDVLHTYLSLKFPLFDTRGTPYLTGGISTDITEQKQAMEIRQQATQEKGTILTNLPIPVCIVNNNRHIAYGNTAAAQCLGSDGTALVGSPIMDILPFTAAQWDQLVAGLRRSIDQEKTHFLEGKLEAHNRSFHYHLFPIALAPGHTQETGIALCDITEASRLQAQLIQMEKMSSLGTLVSGLAHEISNPMQAVLGLSELLAEETDPDAIKELGGELCRIGKQATTVLKDFMSYARTSSNTPQTLVDLNNRLEEAVKMVRRGPHLGHVDVIQAFQPLPTLSARQSEIDQVLINVISNAAQAMEGKGRLILETFLKDHLITVHITDTGGGIPKDTLNKIFDPFFTTKSQGKGTGLGLSIVQKIVAKYEGTIKAHSEEGRGTTFTIQFPASLPSEPTPSAASSVL